MPRSHFYTRRGDDGYTGLLGPERVPKYDPRPEAYGTVDEAQAVLGLARAGGCTRRTGEILLAIQRDLHTLMAELAAARGVPGSADDTDHPFIGSVTAGHVHQLEEWIAAAEAWVEMPQDFVIPGDSPPGAALHVARTVVRRAERLAIRLAHGELLGNKEVIRYLNRLSSLLFVLAVYEDQAAAREGLSSGGRITLAKEVEGE